jgi:hypothetical protein
MVGRALSDLETEASTDGRALRPNRCVTFLYANLRSTSFWLPLRRRLLVLLHAPDLMQGPSVNFSVEETLVKVYLDHGALCDARGNESSVAHASHRHPLTSFPIYGTYRSRP